MKTIKIYTDGSSRGNPGPGGYGIILEYGDHIKEISEGFRLTTNNRMELLSIIIAMESIKDFKGSILVFSDSKYVVDAINKKWVFSWHHKGYKNKKNPDLWKRFLKTYYSHQISFHWIKGHSGHSKNERCDHLAVQASRNQKLKIDEGYELSINSSRDLFN
ncbi:ribonuclease HI [Flavobacteriales bacterium]|nr:ribonuclease HI [Flavobacteriales bacterium]